METKEIYDELKNVNDTFDKIKNLVGGLKQDEICESCNEKLNKIPKLSEPISTLRDSKHRALAAKIWSVLYQGSFVKKNCDFVAGINTLQKELEDLEKYGSLIVDERFYQD
jgi:hypothetical protein